LASEPIQPPQRFGTAASVATIQLRFNLPSREVYSQDWELCCGDPERLDEFLTCYEATSLTDDERFTLMEIIIASFDDWLLLDQPDDTDFNGRMRQQLTTGFKLHACTIYYWCCWDEDTVANPDHQFVATPLMRSIWRTMEQK
jgi:hypothetical protein